MLTLQDGSRLVLAPRAKARLEVRDEKPVARLLAGSWEFALKNLTSVRLFAGERAVTPSAATGQFSMAAPTPVAPAAASAGVMATPRKTLSVRK